MFLTGAAMSPVFLSVQSSMFTTISHTDTGHGSAIYNTGRQAAAATCVAILSAVVASVAGPRLGAFHDAYLAAAAIAAFAGIAAFTLIHTDDAALSMAGR
jgi:hypothetical protein